MNKSKFQSDYYGNPLQFAGAQKFTIEEGIGKGTSVIRVRNGLGLDFTIVPDRAMDIYDVSFNGIQLAWLSRKGIVANSRFSDKGEDWLKSFGGGMIVTCGFRNVGPPVLDNGEEFGLHGRISGIPAENVNIQEEIINESIEITISGEIREASIFGENLLLKRTYKITSLSNTIELHDTIINEGPADEQLMLLYHMNWGYPMLSNKTVLKVPTTSIVMSGEDQSELKLWNNFLKPTPGYQQRMYCIDPAPDKSGRVGYHLENPEIATAVYVSWIKSQLPMLTEWKMMGARDYVLGLEPGNCYPFGRIDTRKSGQFEILKRNSSKEVSLKIEFNKL